MGSPRPPQAALEAASTCNLEPRRPGPRNNNKKCHQTQLSLMGPDLGDWCQKTQGKARWYVPGSQSTTERSPGPLSSPFSSLSAPGQQWVGGRGDTRLMVSEAGGQPPTRPIKLLQRLPQPGSAGREAEKDSRGREANPCLPRRAGLPHPSSALALGAQPAGRPAPGFVSAVAAGRGMTHPGVLS